MSWAFSVERHALTYRSDSGDPDLTGSANICIPCEQHLIAGTMSGLPFSGCEPGSTFFVIFFSKHLSMTILDEDLFPDRDFSTRSKMAGADRSN